MSDDYDPNQTNGTASFHDTCNSLSDTIGKAAGELYGYGTYGAAAKAGPLAGPPLMYAIDKFDIDDKVAEHVGGFVTEGWHSVCGIAEDTGHFLSDTFHGLTDTLSHAYEGFTGNIHIDPVQPGEGEAPEPAASNSGWWGGDTETVASWGGGSTSEYESFASSGDNSAELRDSEAEEPSVGSLWWGGYNPDDDATAASSWGGWSGGDDAGAGSSWGGGSSDNDNA